MIALRHLTVGGMLALKTALDGYQRFDYNKDVVASFRIIINSLAESKDADVWALRQALNEEDARRSRAKVSVSMTDPVVYDRLKLLTPKELNVLKLIAEGHRTQRIAYLMDVAYRTVINHKANISSKLGLGSTRDLPKYAIDNTDFILSPAPA